MKLIDRHIIQKYFASFFFILLLVIAIVVLVDFIEKLDTFFREKPPVEEVVFDYYLNFIPFWGNLLSPIIIYLAVIYFVSRMAQRTELVPLLSGGVSYFRILMPLLVSSILLAGLSFYLKSFYIPDATVARLDFEYKYFSKRKISSNHNIHKKVSPDTYIYIRYYDEKKRKGTYFTLDRTNGRDFSTRIEAKSIEWVDSTSSWLLSNVRRRDIRGKRENLTFIPKLDTTFLLTPGDIFIREEKASSLRLPDLLEYIRLEEMRGSDILNELYIERHRRYSDPMAIIILTLIGFAMSSRKSRGGVALQIGLGLMVAFIYIALLLLGQATVGASLSPGLATWLPNLIFLPVAVVLLFLAPK